MLPIEGTHERGLNNREIHKLCQASERSEICARREGLRNQQSRSRIMAEWLYASAVSLSYRKKNGPGKTP
jgi:hypothetical protein